MADISGKRILMVIAFEDFRDEECFEPKKVFEAAKATVTIASTQKGAAKGKLGGTIQATESIYKVKADDYDAVVFVGGPGAEIYLDEPRAHKIARDFNAAGKVVAAICIAPSILANADLLEAKEATAFSSEEENLEEKGAIWRPSGVVVSGNIVTASGPDYAQEFGKKIVELLAQS